MKSRTSLTTIGVLAALSVAVWIYSQRDTPWEPVSDAAVQKKLVTLSQDYILANHPRWNEELALPAVARQRRSGYVVSYQLPPSTVGGAAVVEFDRNFGITRVYHLQ